MQQILFRGIEDLSINEIESCIELVLEIVLSQEDAVRESDESEELRTSQATVTLFTGSCPNVPIANPITNIAKHHPVFKGSHIESLSPTIQSPPPKFI